MRVAEFLEFTVVVPDSASERRTSRFEWFVVILGGLPLVIPWVLWMGESSLSSTHPIAWYYWMNAAISGPHVYSTYCRLGRKIGEGKVSRWFGLPAYFVSLGVLVLAQRAGLFLQVFTAVNVWQSFHYVRQVYGVSRFYGRGGGASAFEGRLSFWAYHLTVPLFVLGRWDTIFTAWGGRTSANLIPVQMPSWVMHACWGAFFLAVGVGVLTELQRIVRAGRVTKPERLVILVTFYAIHVYGFLSVSSFQRGFMAVTIFHAVQYLGLVWVLQKRYPLPAGSLRTFQQFQRLPFLVFWGILIGLGLLWEHGTMLVPAYTALFLGAISVHHYLVDTFLWRRTAGP